MIEQLDQSALSTGGRHNAPGKRSAQGVNHRDQFRAVEAGPVRHGHDRFAPALIWSIHATRAAAP